MKKTWIFIVLGLVVVAAIVVSLVFLLGDSEDGEEGRSISVSKVSYTKVTGMRIKKDGNVIDIVRTGDGWKYRNNKGAELDQDARQLFAVDQYIIGPFQLHPEHAHLLDRACHGEAGNE